MAAAKKKTPDIFVSKNRDNTPEAFLHWVQVKRPKVLNDKGKYKTFQPTDHQLQIIDTILQPDKKGLFSMDLALSIEPRRHGKSTLYMLIVLWLFFTRDNYTIQLLGNDESHSKRTQLNRLVRTIERSPRLIAKIENRDMTGLEIRRRLYGRVTSVIQGMGGLSLSSSFGDRVNVLWVSDLHACKDTSVFNAWQAAQLDSENTMILVDSNVDSFDGHVHQLQETAEIDPSMYVHHLSYADWADYEKNAPAWIDRKKAKRLQATTLPNEFERDILGKRTQAVNNLFSPEILKSIQKEYTPPCTPEQVEAITAGRKYYIGAGLDRAKNLIQANGSDASVWTVTLKLQDPGKEPKYIILNQKTFTVNSDKLIMGQILKDHDRYEISNIVLENYETAGLYHRLLERQLPVELVTANQALKNISIPEFFRICNEQRLTVPRAATALLKEMTGYIYERKANGQYSFSHGTSRNAHDDHIDSFSWSIYATRELIASTFILDSVVCENNGRGRQFCFLVGGDHILNSCSMRCQAFQTVNGFHQEYLRQQPDSDISLPEFYDAFVKTTVKQYRI